jgi:hypothetical protein
VVLKYCSLVLKVRKEKGLIEERDEFDMMDGNQKTLADRLGTSPEDIERKMNAKRKGMYCHMIGVNSILGLDWNQIY